MLKKIGLWVLIVGFSGFLIWGAVNRTIAKDSDAQNTEARSQGRGQAYETKDSETAKRQGESGAQWGRNNTLSNNAAECDSLDAERGQGQTSAGNRGSSAVSQAQDADHPDDWRQRLGEVTSINETGLELMLADSEMLIIEGQTWRYAQELGMTIQIGDEVSVFGYLEDDEFKIGSLENLTSGQIVILREASGRPVWSGGRYGRAGG